VPPEFPDPNSPIDRKDSQSNTPVDPNEKVGPLGAGATRGVGVRDELGYTIFFENVITTTAPAQEVVVVDRLDSDLDVTTFRVSEIAFGNPLIAVSQVGPYATRVTVLDYRAGMTKTWHVDITTQIAYTTGVVTWTLRTLDPLTGQLPTDPFAGFLPPNDATHRGEGRVSFRIKPRANATLGTVITNKATITFNQEATITTNEVSNTIGLPVYLPLVMR
jgi:hypothetical protein